MSEHRHQGSPSFRSLNAEGPKATNSDWPRPKFLSREIHRMAQDSSRQLRIPLYCSPMNAKSDCPIGFSPSGPEGSRWLASRDAAETSPTGSRRRRFHRARQLRPPSGRCRLWLSLRRERPSRRQRQVDSSREGLQGGLEKRKDARCFREQGAEFRKSRMLAIRPKEHMNSQNRTFDQAGLGEQGKLALDAPDTGLNLTSDLANVEGLVGPAVEERQHSSSGLSENQVSDGCDIRSHLENNCTLNENIFPGTLENLSWRELSDCILGLYPGHSPVRRPRWIGGDIWRICGR